MRALEKYLFKKEYSLSSDPPSDKQGTHWLIRKTDLTKSIAVLITPPKMCTDLDGKVNNASKTKAQKKEKLNRDNDSLLKTQKRMSVLHYPVSACLYAKLVRH